LSRKRQKDRKNVGVGRANLAIGLVEKRTGITCVGSQSMTGGAKMWEKKHPEIAGFLRQLAESHAQQDPTFASTIAYTRLTSAEAIKRLKEQGFAEEYLPAPSTMALIVNYSPLNQRF
jgi:hypothetical protein